MKDRQHARSLYRRFVIAALVLCGSLLALLAAIVVIAPKVINSGEVRSRIETTIAKELRGTMTYDRVELSLLPRPNVVLHGVVIDIPGTLSATIVAVNVRARLIPLFRGQFLVSSVSLEQPVLTLMIQDDSTKHLSRRPSAKQPAGESLDKTLAVMGRELPDLFIKLSRGKIGMLREGRPFLSLSNLDASLSFVADRQDIPNAGTAGTDYHVTGTARAMLSGTTALPAPLTVSIDRFDATPGSLTVKSSRARIQDLDAVISGGVTGYLTGSPRSDFSARGTIGPDTLAWLQTLAGLPEGVSIRAPLTITEARLRSTVTGSGVSRRLTITAGKRGDTIVSLALRREPGLFSIDDLRVKDSDSDAVVKLSSGRGESAFSFTGNLTGATIDRVLEGGRFSSSWIKGDLRAELLDGKWDDATVHGSLEGGQIAIPLSSEIPVSLDRFTALADGSTVELKSLALSLGQDKVQVEGSAAATADGIELDLNVATDLANLSTLRNLVKRNKPEQHADQEQVPVPGRRPGVSGRVRFRAAAFVMDRYHADGLDVLVNFGKERTTATLDHASICGVTFAGTLRTVGNDMEVSLKPRANGKKLESSLPCILLQDLGISGTYNLSGQIGSRGTLDTLLRSVEGSFVFSASEGRIQSDHVVKGVIAYLNSTSLLKGSHDKLLKEGVPFETINLRGTLHDGSISLSEGVIKSRDLHIVTAGDIDIREGTLALDVLAAPFTRLDRVLGSVPIVKSLVGDALVVVPARVEGSFEKPTVKPLPVSNVGMNVKNLMKNTIHAPMKIIDPAISNESERKIE